MVKLIVSIDEGGLIGNGDRLPWQIDAEMDFFRNTTLNHWVMMGRGTWDCLQVQPLPQRVNLVASTTMKPHFDYHLVVSPSVSDLLTYYKNELVKGDLADLYIIGGKSMYDLFLVNEIPDELIVTTVYGVHEGDVFFGIIPQCYEKQEEPIMEHPEFIVHRYVKS